MGTLAVLGNPKMSGDVRAIEYVHADDGLLYRHDFNGGASMHATGNGRAVTIRAPGKTVRLYDGQPFLVNPKRKGRNMAAKRKPPKPYRTWAAWSKAMQRARKSGTKKNPRRRASAGQKKTTRKTTTRSKPTMATRRKRRAPARRRSTARRAAPRRRSYRRNPPRRRDLIGKLTDATVGALQVIGGKVIVRSVPQMLGLPKSGALGIAVQAGVALLAGTLADRVLGVKAGEMVMIGALTSPLESAIAGLNIPFVSPALMPAGLGSYVRVPAGRRGSIGRYPHTNGLGAYVHAGTEYDAQQQ